MNYLKRIGRLVAICICAVCVGKELLNETMEELNLSEQMSINGGGINASMVWYNLYGAFAKHGCAYPVGYKST